MNKTTIYFALMLLSVASSDKALSPALLSTCYLQPYISENTDKDYETTQLD